MKQRKTFMGWVVCGALACMLSVNEVGAQGLSVTGGGGAGAGLQVAQAGDAMADAISIRKMPRLNSSRDWTFRTPVFAGPSARNPKEWGVFEVGFDSKPEWIDELTVTFHLMLQSVDAREKQPFSLYRVTSRYIDVERGRGKAVSAVLLPSALVRHGKPIAFGVEFAIDGQVVASDSAIILPTLGERWWENSNVVDNPRTVRREGYLLERSKTPFGMINIDDNEVSR